MSNTVLFTCPYIPPEWITACGFKPSRILPQTIALATQTPAEGICPYTRGFIDEVKTHPDARAIIVTSACDQMRRAGEWIDRDSGLPVFLMTMPSTWETENACNLYLAELERLERYLKRLGGDSLSTVPLSSIMELYHDSRETLRSSRQSLTPRQFSEAIATFNRNGSMEFLVERPSPPKTGCPIALVGGPLTQTGFAVFDLIERLGGYVALDATESGEISLPAPFDPKRFKTDPLAMLVDAYFGSIPGIFRRPNSRLFQWLKEKIEERGVRGILVWRYLWCDLWNAEVSRLKESTGLPVSELVVENDFDPTAIDGVSTRIQALLETAR